MTKKPKIIRDEIDLHGMTVDEAIPRIEEFLYAAYQSKLRRVWIVHGKGTGTLKQEVVRYLQKSSLVRSFQPADSSRGGYGTMQIDLN